ncbi:Amidase [Dorcoceras hygrometricum]|uniref:Amidase n=1 Tax=Dorcoceras hygrometricum TaxID=472368 RepID=A0A2Z7BU09_9LAMI|nr:Amidase [Dorcoceras hygrometricum]
MVKKKVMLPADEVDLATVKYQHEIIEEPETQVIPLEEDGKPEERVEVALKYLPEYDLAMSWSSDSSEPFRYWKIRDYAYAYRSKLTTPSIVAERFISAIDEFKNISLPSIVVSSDPENIRKQAAASTRRFEEGGTTFFHEIRPVEEDADSVARLRSCGVIFVGKANMHELGLGTTGNNPNYGYSAILGSSAADRIALRPWFNDVFSTDITEKCEDVINRLTETHGCKTVEIVIPELHEMRNAHIVSIGSESVCTLNPDFEDGKRAKFTNDTRTNLALFRSFTASDYVAAQCLRRRIMLYLMDIFKKVDVIITPTTGMTAPLIPPAALKSGETDLKVSGNLMRFVTLANLLGLPAISVPVGYDKQGLPIGLQLIGRPWCEASILRLAATVEVLFL